MVPIRSPETLCNPRMSFRGCHIPDTRAPLGNIIPDWGEVRAQPSRPCSGAQGGPGRSQSLPIQSVASAVGTSRDVIGDVMLVGHDVMCPRLEL